MSLEMLAIHDLALRGIDNARATVLKVVEQAPEELADGLALKYWHHVFKRARESADAPLLTPAKW